MERWIRHPGGRPRKRIAGQITQEPANGVYYTVEEAAELLGVHVHTIQSRMRSGEIAGKKISGVWRIYKDELLREKGAGK